MFGGGKIPRRVVCFAPSYAETLIELGLKDRIVGVTESSDYLEELKNVDRVGGYINPSIEKIISLEPDIVLAAGFAGQRPVIRKLNELGVEVVVFEAMGIEEIFGMVKSIGEVFGVEDRSMELVLRMREVIGNITGKTCCLPKPSVYVEVGFKPLFTCGKGSFIHELIEIAGGKNIAGDIKKPFPQVSAEFVLSKDPEVIILSYMGRNFGKEVLFKRYRWGKISALRKGRVYDDIGFHVITIPSPRLVLNGLPELAKRIHPGID